MKLCLTLIFLFSIFFVLLEASSIKFHKLENCSASGKSVSIEKCEIAGNNMQMIVDIKKPITKVFVTFQFNRKDSLLLQQMFKPIPIEWCGFMKNQKSNRITKVFLDSVSKSIPQLFQQCPLKDKLTLNIAFSDKLPMIQMMPTGVYQFYLKTNTDEENPLFEMSVLVKIFE